jgi:AraC-like DNA-binding protein
MPIPPDVYKKIVTAKLYMDENFHEPIDLRHISRQACLSRFHFHRLFTRIYQRTPHRYLTQKRIEHARRMLAGKELTVSEICNQVGFESIGSFSTLFKKEIGSAPQNYRHEALMRQELTKQAPAAVIPHCHLEIFGLTGRN